MLAITLREYGGPEVLVPASVDDPVPGRGQVRVKVAATSVNRPDIVQRQGNYSPPPGESDILGLEIAGVIDVLGEGVSGWKPGDRVMALVGGGGYAELALAHAGHLVAIPESMSFEEAACVCEAYITAYLNVFLLGRLGDGEAVLLHGGGGGVNTAALQLCRHLVRDACIMVTASSGKLARVRELGADLAIDYRAEDFADAVRTYTNKQGADVILDHLGGAYLAGNMKCLAVGGRLLVIGVMGGAKAELNLALMMVKRQQIIGSVLRSRPLEEKNGIIEQFRVNVLPLLAERDIVPLVHEVLPLREAAAAHRLMESSAHFGKIVLRP